MLSQNSDFEYNRHQDRPPSFATRLIRIGRTHEVKPITSPINIVNSQTPSAALPDFFTTNAPARLTTSFDEWAILGGVRFLLAMLVLLGHCNDFRLRPGTGWTSAGAAFGGQAAVYGFLFISGYSMAHSLRHPRGFYLRRVRRIMPLYLAGLFVGLAVTEAAGGSITMPSGAVVVSPHFWEFAGNALLLQLWICAPVPCNGPLWTISAEAFYYLIAPLLRWAKPWMLCLLIWISATAQFLCRTSFLETRWGFATLMMAWAWVGGFYWYGHRKGTTMVLLVVMGCWFGRFKYSDMADVTIVFSAAVMIAAPRIALLRLCRAPLLYLGELSYPLYVFHWPTIVGLVGLRGVKDPNAWVVGSIGMAMLGYHLIDNLFRSSPLVRASRVQSAVQSGIAPERTFARDPAVT